MSNNNGKNGSNGTHAGTWAGSKRKDGKIRVAIVGVGNCASSLVQGRYYYENAKDDDFVPGLMHVNLGGYHVKRHRVRGRVRRRQEQGRQGPVRGDLHEAEQHATSSSEVPHDGRQRSSAA